MFRVNEMTSMGFQMDLTNGYTISVQFSPFHACSNKKFAKEYREQLLNKRIGDFSECSNAEIAVKDTVTEKFVTLHRKLIDAKTKEVIVIKEDAQGYRTVNDLIHLINEVRDYPNTDSKMEENRKNSINKRKVNV